MDKDGLRPPLAKRCAEWTTILHTIVRNSYNETELVPNLCHRCIVTCRNSGKRNRTLTVVIEEDPSLLQHRAETHFLGASVTSSAFENTLQFYRHIHVSNPCLIQQFIQHLSQHTHFGGWCVCWLYCKS